LIITESAVLDDEDCEYSDDDDDVFAERMKNYSIGRW